LPAAAASIVTCACRSFGQAITAAAGATNTLRLTVVPIGDYSTYTLALRDPDPTKPNTPYPGIDPIFHAIEFKFRPGCFNLNCAPTFTKAAAAPGEPVIDYLAKDYDSFKHVLIGALQERVPDWKPTSEADLDQVLIDLIAADADESSDFQDRVVSEGVVTEGGQFFVYFCQSFAARGRKVVMLKVEGYFGEAGFSTRLPS